MRSATNFVFDLVGQVLKWRRKNITFLSQCPIVEAARTGPRIGSDWKQKRNLMGLGRVELPTYGLGRPATILNGSERF